MNVMPSLRETGTATRVDGKMNVGECVDISLFALLPASQILSSSTAFDSRGNRLVPFPTPDSSAGGSFDPLTMED